MLLRPTCPGEYKIIGDIYVHGMMDGEGLIGPIPSQWKVKVVRGIDGGWQRLFQHKETKARTMEDPRLIGIPLLPDWVPMQDSEKTRYDPRVCAKFYNKQTGEFITSDPRLSYEALLTRGVQLQIITLV